MDTALFDYRLPPEHIAGFPARERTASRLLMVPAGDGGALREIRFAGLGELLRPGDLLVANDTRVLPARLLARKPSGGRVEILLERMVDDGTALVQVRANKPLRLPQTLTVGDGDDGSSRDRETVTLIKRHGDFFILTAADPAALFHRHGSVPLPPYINRAPARSDVERYQTVYASDYNNAGDGSVAAPTAGLHFDRKLIHALTAAGIGWATITLHVGAGTFQPVRTQSATAHRMHRERITVSGEVCEQIRRAKTAGRRIIAIGTTVVRALESAARAERSAQPGELKPFSGDTDLYILPGYNFRVVDALITNFHLPRSTLLMLVCAFAGRKKIMAAYHHAIADNFRFYSYGDAMFVERRR